jgi:monofunctional biosynthetic peptidoglycan transglycosylase
MPPQQIYAGSFLRRPDRSLGWAALESKQAAALCRALALLPVSPGPAETGISLPPELLPFPPALRRRRDGGEIARLVLAWVIALQLCYLAATALLISIYRYVDPPVTVLMAYRTWSFGWKIEAPRPIRLPKVPRYIRSMLVAIEDDKFYEHHGIDFEAFKRAREINKRVGKPLYGGSTLTMQVARTLFLVPEKSYIRKYFEVLTALELEALLPKQRILELYFGYAEWGKGLFGIESASHKWYGRDISSLSRDEAARLIALLSSPVKYGPATLHKNGILRERYSYLSNRYNPPPAEAATASGEAPASGGAASTEASDATRPPPSPEPGVDVDESAAPAAP